MKLVDSHCHINLDPLGDRIPELLKNAGDNDVAFMLCVSVNLEDFPQVLDLARSHEHVFASVGVHPNEQDSEEPSTARLVELGLDPDVVAIGETGLDYFRSTGDLEWQKERFRRHIAAAQELGKPLIIHTREAPDDTIRILRDEDAESCGGVMHCFTENWDLAKQALDIGFYISMSGIVTFKNAATVQEVARKVPLDRLLVETDCPYLAPVPYRGKVNEPSYVRHTAEFIAELRNESLETIAEATTSNFFKLFHSAG
jgi:TatD DNase family protein